MTSRGRIGVVGTNATLRSNAFGKAIHNIRADVQVYGNPCPLLVHLVENGLVQQENPITRLTVQMYLEPLMKEQIDTLILGCTHLDRPRALCGRLGARPADEKRSAGTAAAAGHHRIQCHR